MLGEPVRLLVESGSLALALPLAAAAAACRPAARPTMAQERSIVVASTTSTEQSGLFGHILPLFTRDTGIAVRVVALGTGQALDVARRGDADVVFVHDRETEERFVADGYRPPPALRSCKLAHPPQAQDKSAD